MYSYIFPALVCIYFACSLLLVLYGLHHCGIIFLFLRALKKPQKEAPKLTIQADCAPKVLTQIPLYNEANVAERVIRAVAALRYPNHHIQILDDSNDETSDIVSQLCAELSAEGITIDHVQREDRRGYKAGALAYGMTLVEAPYLAIFDSDFLPEPDFLEQTIPYLIEDEGCGMVQTRWDHLNAQDSAFTKAQGVGIDSHFVVEQIARSNAKLFFNFNGTGGVWRSQAIRDAGGWSAETLTEDLDLSYRAQLAGWHFRYLPTVTVPAELPPTFQAFRSQQFRWAKGSIQTAIKMLPRIWKANISFHKKLAATFHMTHYGLHLCLLIHALLGLPIALSGTKMSHWLETITSGLGNSIWWYLFPMALAMLAPTMISLFAELWISPKRWLYFIKRYPMMLCLGFGLCLSNSRACIEGILGIKSPFVRTPKRGDGAIQRDAKRSLIHSLEITLGLYTLTTAILYAIDLNITVALIFLLYACGLTLFGVRGWAETSRA